MHQPGASRNTAPELHGAPGESCGAGGWSHQSACSRRCWQMSGRRPLSNIEHLAEVNIACSVRLAGRLNLAELRTALACLQRCHPALRALIRPENDVLYYEPDAAPEIPMRAIRVADEAAYCGEWQFELSTAFHHELPQLRVVY